MRQFVLVYFFAYHDGDCYHDKDYVENQQCAIGEKFIQATIFDTFLISDSLAILIYHTVELHIDNLPNDDQLWQKL